MVMVTPIGRPRPSRLRITGHCGRSQRAYRRKSAKRGETRRYNSAKASNCTQNIAAEAQPRPAAPIAGKPNTPLVST